MVGWDENTPSSVCPSRPHFLASVLPSLPHNFFLLFFFPPLGNLSSQTFSLDYQGALELQV